MGADDKLSTCLSGRTRPILPSDVPAMLDEANRMGAGVAPNLLLNDVDSGVARMVVRDEDFERLIVLREGRAHRLANEAFVVVAEQRKSDQHGYGHGLVGLGTVVAGP